MATIKKTIVINAPIEKVFAYANDPMHTPDYWPSMVEIRNVKDNEGGKKTYEWTYKMGGMRFDGSSEDVEVVQNKRVKTVSKGGIESTITWEFTPVQNGTQLEILTEYKVPVPVLGRLAENLILKLNEREADTLMANLKTIMETPQPVERG